MTHKTQLLWIVSLAISLLLLLFTGVIIYKFSNSYHPDQNQITNEQELTAYLNKNWPKEDHPENQLIPTGIFIQSLNFLSSNNVYLTGFVWQKYNKENINIDKKGVEFSEGADVKITESYRKVEGDILTIVWYFEGQFSQSFDYSDFPLDNKVVEIRMCPIEFDKDIVFIPDLNSYDSTIKTDKFGVEPEIVLAGFSLLETFFSFKKIHYDTNFGIKDYKRKEGFHELTYNISLKREVINSAIIYFLPLWTVVTLMLFGVLLITVRDEDLPFFGYSLMNLLALASFLLFIIVLSHSQLRTQVISQHIMYLERIYIISYVAIVYAILIAFVVDNNSRKNKGELLGHDGIWAKITYLPFVSFAMFLSTYLSFMGRW